MNANDQLSQYSCTDLYYRYIMGLLITDGVKALADQFQCYWYLDIIASYQSELKGQDFQVWQLQKQPDDSALVICTDGNDNILKKQLVHYTDFKATMATVWVEGNVLLLPSEH